MTPEEFKAKADEYETKAKADADEKEALKKTIADMQANMPAAALKTAADEDEAKKKADSEKEAKEKADADEKEKEEAKAKADSEVRTRLADMESRMPKVLSDADIAKIAQTQSRADGVFRAFGDSAPAPIAGESALGYRKRMIGKLKEHSAAWSAMPMEAISDSIIDVVESQVYADAAVAARSPVAAAGMGLREMITRSRAGHEISTFVGRISDFTSMFKPPVRKFVSGFKKTSD